MPMRNTLHEAEIFKKKLHAKPLGGSNTATALVIHEESV